MKNLLLIALCSLSGLFASRAQGLYNDSELHIGSVSVWVDGDVVNDGKINNDGLIGFTGDWKNEDRYDGSGTVEVLGNNPQIITHRGQAIESFIINGWGTKYISGELKVSGKLQLDRGVVHVSSRDMLMLTAKAQATGGSTDSYVDGALTVEGHGYKYFPIGKNGIFAPIEFLSVPHKTGRFSMEVFENAPTVFAENVLIKRSLYWQRQDLMGDFAGSAIAVDYERDFFHTPENIILLTADSFDETFQIVTDLQHSEETDKIFTTTSISSKIIMLGEISDKWTEADFYMPTALSPNAAYSENTHAKIFGDRLEPDGFHLQIFDRWGDLVYESRSLEHMQEKGWDGRSLRGQELSTGAYPYRLTARDKMGKRFERKGVITIIH